MGIIMNARYSIMNNVKYGVFNKYVNYKCYYNVYC